MCWCGADISDTSGVLYEWGEDYIYIYIGNRIYLYKTFQVECFFSGFTQTITQIHENIEVFWTYVHLIKVIYIDRPIQHFQTCSLALLVEWENELFCSWYKLQLDKDWNVGWVISAYRFVFCTGLDITASPLVVHRPGEACCNILQAFFPQNVTIIFRNISNSEQDNNSIGFYAWCVDYTAGYICLVPFYALIFQLNHCF